jgi:hypothetical protein
MPTRVRLQFSTVPVAVTPSTTLNTVYAWRVIDYGHATEAQLYLHDR